MFQRIRIGCVLILSIFFIDSLSGQDKKKPCIAGVYHTADDLQNNRLSHQINTMEKGDKFGFLFPADLRLTIRITKPDTTLEFKPGSVFGYGECGNRYRYYPGGDLLAQEDFYRIEEQRGIIIYSSKFVSGDEMFYSRTINSPIHRLSLGNIEKDFADQPGFVDDVRCLNKEGLRGDIAKKDKKGKFIINTIYAKKVGR
jgi:hypothetical protein